MATQVVSVGEGNGNDAEYLALVDKIQMRFWAKLESNRGRLFQTDSVLWEEYLAAFAPGDRQYHDCHACRKFIDTYGGLVFIDESGRTSPALWEFSDGPDIAVLSNIVKKAKVTGVFLSSLPIWGMPQTGPWRHFAVTPPTSLVYGKLTVTAHQATAAKAEDFKNVMTALNEFTQPHLETAVTLLKTDSLYRSEKILGQAEWLLALSAARSTAKGAAKANIVWRAIASAPDGFCHPRSGMIGTLLEDIAAGMDYEDVALRFASKMHPLSYQRPKASPASGAIAAAEKIVAQLGAAGSLARRFARLDEVMAFWKPKAVEESTPADGVFGHLRKAAVPTVPKMVLPTQVMTWEKFTRDVLPGAEQIEFFAPRLGPYCALVTAVNIEAPPILQWDTPEHRNPVSWYFWNGGSTAGSFGLIPGAFIPVDVLALKPSQWNGGNEHQGSGVMFVLRGAKETRNSGLCLFPEIMKAEFHGIRSVIEAHSRTGQIEGMEEPHAAGVMFDKAGKWDATLRVMSGGKTLGYRIDRFD